MALAWNLKLLVLEDSSYCELPPLALNETLSPPKAIDGPASPSRQRAHAEWSDVAATTPSQPTEMISVIITFFMFFILRDKPAIQGYRRCPSAAASDGHDSATNRYCYRPRILRARSKPSAVCYVTTTP